MTDKVTNLADLVSGGGHKFDLKLNNESTEDAQARRTEQAADARQRRGMTWAIFVFALVMVLTIFLGCVAVFVNGAAEEKKWAAGIVSAMASGLVGFLVGHGRKPG